MRHSHAHFPVFLFFFFSGLTCLIYEIIWTRLITGIIGAAPFAVSIVLTVFMGGLGLGSYIAGRFVDRIERPGDLLRAYGLLEIAVGIFGVAVPLLITISRPVYAVLYNRLFEHFFLYSILTFIGCALILILPVICMGATLPLLARFIVRNMSNAGFRLGGLYGLNTVGAAAGSLLCGFWLIRFTGVWGSLAAAIVLNILIGTASGIIGRSMNNDTPESSVLHNVPTEAPDPAQRFPRIIVIAALVIFGVSGFCSMSCEVIWTGLLGLVVGPTTYSFTVVLVTFITGLGLGSIVFGYIADRKKNPFVLLLFTQVIAVVFALAASHLMGNSQIFFARLIYHFRGHFATMMYMKTLLLFLFMIGPTFCLGAAFPLVMRITARTPAGIGRTVGNAYAVNTAGSVLGSFCAGFVLIPLLGREGGITFVAVLQVATVIVAAIAAFISFPVSREDIREYVLVGLVAVIGLVYAVPYPRWNRAMLSTGKYHRFYDLPGKMNLGWIDTFLYGSAFYSRFMRGKSCISATGSAVSRPSSETCSSTGPRLSACSTAGNRKPRPRAATCAPKPCLPISRSCSTGRPGTSSS